MRASKGESMAVAVPSRKGRDPREWGEIFAFRELALTRIEGQGQ
jgi:hypothetical protein